MNKFAKLTTIPADNVAQATDMTDNLRALGFRVVLMFDVVTRTFAVHVYDGVSK